MKIDGGSLDELCVWYVERIVGKGEMLVTSIFSFSLNVSKSRLSQCRYNSSLFVEQLTQYTVPKDKILDFLKTESICRQQISVHPNKEISLDSTDNIIEKG